MGEHVFKKPLLIQCNKETRREIQQNVVKKIPKKQQIVIFIEEGQTKEEIGGLCERGLTADSRD